MDFGAELAGPEQILEIIQVLDGYGIPIPPELMMMLTPEEPMGDGDPPEVGNLPGGHEGGTPTALNQIPGGQPGPGFGHGSIGMGTHTVSQGPSDFGAKRAEVLRPPPSSGPPRPANEDEIAAFLKTILNR
jgi:hypothetical protein